MSSIVDGDGERLMSYDLILVAASLHLDAQGHRRLSLHIPSGCLGLYKLLIPQIANTDKQSFQHCVILATFRDDVLAIIEQR